MKKEIRVDRRKVDEAAIIDLQGDVNASGEEAIKGAYHAVTEEGAENILFNLKEAEYINTSGIAVLIGIVMEAQEAKQKVLVYGVSSHYQKIFELVRLPMYVDMFDTEQAALASLGIDPEAAQ
ncbi:MAG: STAS domain-containing protein [Anaerolineae bacterium]